MIDKATNMKINVTITKSVVLLKMNKEAQNYLFVHVEEIKVINQRYLNDSRTRGVKTYNDSFIVYLSNIQMFKQD